MSNKKSIYADSDDDEPLYKNNGQPWTDDDNQKLLKYIKDNKPLFKIASNMERSSGAITSQLQRLCFKMYTDEKKSDEELQQIFRLSQKQVEQAITRGQKEAERKVQYEAKNEELKQIMNILCDIQKKVNKLCEHNNLTFSDDESDNKSYDSNDDSDNDNKNNKNKKIINIKKHVTHNKSKIEIKNK